MPSTITALLLALSTAVFSQGTAPDCRDWKACRELALDAANKQDYEVFHDLAWKTFTAGPRNDPSLMTLLARAQSLSGRPHDALVMLNRLAAMGVATDASTSDDFARVRALPGWAELEAKLASLSNAPAAPSGAPKPAAATDAAAAKAKKATAPPIKEIAGKEAPIKEALITETPVKESAAAASSKPGAKPAASPAPEAPPPLAFSSVGITTTGLAYDAVSGRFIVADGRDRRLLVLGERSGRLASLAGIDAGLGEITAIEIDAREGDLWVVSTSTSARESTLHKLQLISGRVLFSIPVPLEQGASRFTDVAITPQHVLVLDSEGRRVFRAAKKGKTLDVAARLAATVGSLAPVSDTIVYGAYDRGLIRIDLATKTFTVVDPARSDADLAGLTWLRWHRGGLVGVQKKTDGSHRLVRIRLDDAGRTARSVEGLDDAVLPAGPTAVTIVDNVVYYLSKPTDKDELAIRKITLK